MKTDLLMHVYFLLYIYVLCSFKLVFTNYPFNDFLSEFSRLTLFFIYNAWCKNFFNYFLSEYAIFDFWNVEF